MICKSGASAAAVSSKRTWSLPLPVAPCAMASALSFFYYCGPLKKGDCLSILEWAQHNSYRLDVVRVTPKKSKDFYIPDVAGRGHLVKDQVLPVENRHFNHWNTDPGDLHYGGERRELEAATIYLLPYYLGLYQGYIKKPLCLYVLPCFWL